MRGFLRLCAAGGVLLCAATASAGPDSYPLSKVQRGQTGHAFTTFTGTTPSKWAVEIISVVPNMLPKQDIILFKSTDPQVAPFGVYRGMSGSPLYIDGKIACAIAYAWSFNKIVMGGCTPIEYMRKDGDAARRQPVVNGPNGVKIVKPIAASMDDWRRLTPKVDVSDALAALGPANKNWLLSAPLPVKHVPSAPVHEGQTLTASVPLAIAGFSAPAYNQLAAMFADTGLSPIRSGGTTGSGGEAGPKAFVPGGAIAVELIRGDMGAAGTGTVTSVDGAKVLAFGHPMFGNGEWYAPVSSAYVHHVLHSAQIGSVIASPRHELGSLVQDRQAAIMADTGLRSPMVPVEITVVSTAGKNTTKGEFKVEVLNNKFFTGPVTGAAVMNAVGYFLPDRDAVTARIDSVVRIKGVPDPITFVDYAYAADGAGTVMAGVRGLRVLVPLLMNPYKPVQIEKVEIKVDLRFEINFGEIKEVLVPSSELVVGRNLVDVRMTTYDGKEIYEKVPIDVPANLAGSIVQLEVTSGDAARLDAAPPVDLPSLLTAFRKLLPGNVWSVTLYPADEGVALDGKLVKDLPPTAQDKLRPQTRTQRAQPYKPMARTLSPANRVVEGTSTMLVRVRK
jgi:hypothetical protein